MSNHTYGDGTYGDGSWGSFSLRPGVLSYGNCQTAEILTTPQIISFQVDPKRPHVPKSKKAAVVVHGGSTASPPAYRIAPERFDFRHGGTNK